MRSDGSCTGYIGGGDRRTPTGRTVYAEPRIRPTGLDWDALRTEPAAPEPTPVVTPPMPAPPRTKPRHPRTRKPAPKPKRTRGGQSGPRLGRRTTDDVEIVRRYTAGQTPPQIGAALGHTARTIRTVLDRGGVQRRDDRAGHSGRRNNPSIVTDSPALVADVRRLYGSGLSRARVAAHLNIGAKTVQSLMRRHGIPARQRQSGRADGAAALKARIAAAGQTSTGLRAWARAADLPCPATGTVPATVLDAYLAAREDA